MIRIFRICFAYILSILVCFELQAQNPYKKASFDISGTEVPDSIMNVVSYCADVWSNYVSSDVTIHVSVSWQELKSNVNAYAKPTTYYAINGIYYPCALAEKMQHKNLNGKSADIEVVINKTIAWHTDVESSPAEKTYDLATTLIHEFAHGFGLIGNITEETLSSSEFPSPTIYDMFICDSVMNPIVSAQSGTYSIKNDLLTSDNLFWGGQFAKAYCGEFLQLYAPTKFNSGSTAYHLNEEKYAAGSGYELMTPVIRSTEILHNPDIPTIAMLADLGWTDYFVSYTQLANSADLENPITISFCVKDTLFAVGKQFVNYSFDAGNHAVTLSASGENVISYYNLSAEIPAFAFDHTVSYSITLVSTNGDTIQIPQMYPNTWNTAFYGDDSEAPLIEHTPITSISKNVKSLSIVATITDNFSVDRAFVEYVIGQDSLKALCEFEGDVATATIPFDDGLTAGDVLQYRILAIDASENSSYFENGTWQNVLVEEPQEPIYYFMTDFESDTIANYFSFDKFSIKQETGFANKALHSAHPYANSGADGKYNQYIATLKRPIIIASNPAVMTFDEVVIAEPGKAGVEYGSFGFWDFVIVEASKDMENWYALGKKGWDSQLFSAWKTRFYSQIKTDGDNENSLAVGDSTLFKSHTINLLENKYFRTGDTVYVRFRLQSDATNFGWGWAIDNLKIQERVALPIIPLAISHSIVYPNPCKDVLHIQSDNVECCSVLDLNGKNLLQTNNTSIVITGLSSGVYVLKIYHTDGTIETTQFVKH